jgi:hypothetical protein
MGLDEDPVGLVYSTGVRTWCRKKKTAGDFSPAVLNRATV